MSSFHLINMKGTPFPVYWFSAYKLDFGFIQQETKKNVQFGFKKFI